MMKIKIHNGIPPLSNQLYMNIKRGILCKGGKQKNHYLAPSKQMQTEYFDISEMFFFLESVYSVLKYNTMIVTTATATITRVL